MIDAHLCVSINQTQNTSRLSKGSQRLGAKLQLLERNNSDPHLRSLSLC